MKEKKTPVDGKLVPQGSRVMKHAWNVSLYLERDEKRGEGGQEARVSKHGKGLKELQSKGFRSCDYIIRTHALFLLPTAACLVVCFSSRQLLVSTCCCCLLVLLHRRNRLLLHLNPKVTDVLLLALPLPRLLLSLLSSSLRPPYRCPKRLSQARRRLLLLHSLLAAFRVTSHHLLYLDPARLVGDQVEHGGEEAAVLQPRDVFHVLQHEVISRRAALAQLLDGVLEPVEPPLSQLLSHCPLPSGPLNCWDPARDGRSRGRRSSRGGGVDAGLRGGVWQRGDGRGGGGKSGGGGSLHAIPSCMSALAGSFRVGLSDTCPVGRRRTRSSRLSCFLLSSRSCRQRREVIVVGSRKVARVQREVVG
mmetsp:Transcript_33837/g.106137  ORF Transcript_33837/g.106137 Transcript_33837/m.106137 type:complete len:362 (-) Transcript_33837:996-2081(-)